MQNVLSSAEYFRYCFNDPDLKYATDANFPHGLHIRKGCFRLLSLTISFQRINMANLEQFTWSNRNCLFSRKKELSRNLAHFLKNAHGLNVWYKSSQSIKYFYYLSCITVDLLWVTDTTDKCSACNRQLSYITADFCRILDNEVVGQRGVNVVGAELRHSDTL